MWGVAVEVDVGNRVEAAVSADDVEDGALGADAGNEGVEPAGGGHIGGAVCDVLEGYDSDNHDADGAVAELRAHRGASNC